MNGKNIGNKKMISIFYVKKKPKNILLKYIFDNAFILFVFTIIFKLIKMKIRKKNNDQVNQKQGFTFNCFIFIIFNFFH